MSCIMFYACFRVYHIDLKRHRAPRRQTRILFSSKTLESEMKIMKERNRTETSKLEVSEVFEPQIGI